MCGREARMGTDFWVVKGKRIAVDGALKRKKRVLFLFMFKALKWNNACNYCVQRCDTYVLIPSICNQSIPIDINLSIDCYWKSIPINNHTNLSHRWVIDYPYHLINWYRLVLIIKFIDWIPWDSTTHDIICAKNARWLQSAGICNETNTQKRSCWHCNIWPDWYTSYQLHYSLLYNGIPEFMRKPLMLTVK